MSESGRVTWPSQSNPLWEFDWSLNRAPNADGLVVRNVSYRGHKVLHRGSLPSLSSGNMPGTNGLHTWHLNYNTAEFSSSNPSKKVHVYSGYYGNTSDIGIEVTYEFSIGGGTQRWTQRWRFWEDGHIQPQLYSWFTRYVNRNWYHLPDWRFDFDIEGAPDDLALRYDRSVSGNRGWGTHWIPETTERRWWIYSPEGRLNGLGEARIPGTSLRWAVLNKQSPYRGYNIAPRFSQGYEVRFVDIVRYHWDETGQTGVPYRYTTLDSDGEWVPGGGKARYQDGEDLDGKDVVVWYGGSMVHREKENAWNKELTSDGPNLWPFRYH